MDVFHAVLIPLALLVLGNSVYRAVRTNAGTRWQVRWAIAAQACGAFGLLVLPVAYPEAEQWCALVMIAGQAALQLAVAPEWRNGPPPGYSRGPRERPAPLAPANFRAAYRPCGRNAASSHDADERRAA